MTAPTAAPTAAAIVGAGREARRRSRARGRRPSRRRPTRGGGWSGAAIRQRRPDERPDLGGGVPEEHVAGVDATSRSSRSPASRRSAGAQRAASRSRPGRRRPASPAQGTRRATAPARAISPHAPTDGRAASSGSARVRRAPGRGRWRGPRPPCRGRGAAAAPCARRAPPRRPPSPRRGARPRPRPRPARGASSTAGSSSTRAPHAAGRRGGEVQRQQPAEGVAHHGRALHPGGVERVEQVATWGSMPQGGSQVESPWPRRSGAITRTPGQLLPRRGAGSAPRVGDAVDDQHRGPPRGPRRARGGAAWPPCCHPVPRPARISWRARLAADAVLP